MSKKTRSPSSTEVMSAVASSIEFIKSQIASDLMNAKTNGSIDLENNQLRKIANIIELSITQSFLKSSSQIESKLRK